MPAKTTSGRKRSAPKRTSPSPGKRASSAPPRRKTAATKTPTRAKKPAAATARPKRARPSGKTRDLGDQLEPLIAAWLEERAGSLGNSVSALLAERLAGQQKVHAAELVALQAGHDERVRLMERERDAEQRDAELRGRRELSALERRSRDAVERAERDAETGLREAKARVRKLERELRGARAKAERVETRLHDEHERALQSLREEGADRLAKIRLDHENELAALESRLQELERSREALREAVGQVDFSTRSSRRSRRLSH
jgi:hypothetical protein